MTSLDGARVALLEARLSSELAALVRREGGEPVCAPAVMEVASDVRAEIPALIDAIQRGECEIVVLLTGAGLDALLEQASSIGLLEHLVDALSRVMTVCRGPKPAAVLRRHRIPVRLSAASPHTTSELLAILPDTVVGGRSIALLHDGGGNQLLVDALRLRGAQIRELRAYEWRLPADLAPVEHLVEQLIEGRVDAVAFTNQVQIRHLLEVGVRMKRGAALLYALRHRTIVGSIGPTCTAVLTEAGVAPDVVASPPRMRPLVMAVASCLAARRSHPFSEAVR
jgi:uroporphyrinogen-III synthase